ncbi:hypothetical protein Focb16_v004339 [Fusarium oxysporum f. sp. cubense]|uniref:HTH CENPB-type domain-containing protein n=1 Tax=Fusarium oxysporum f. sp. cubense TaxID=61366 RepID=A0A559KS81_FUSOC|nr:hypothetical protein Focb16_v004339 [Fusarium oxysporum f. sp. cubense]
MPQLSYTEEEDVIQAMLDVTDNGLSQNQAAQKNGVPQTTLSDRLRGLPSRSEITQSSQLLSKSQESRLVTWILRQEALGYAPSHSQVRATVAALLRQQGRERHIGVHWLARFIKRHPDIETKVGKRQEATRFNSFTPMAVNWYFGIRESEYGWIKRENTVNVDEGGIMAVFVEWLKEVYLPQTQPADESDARLIILDGHGSHVSDEWMATCFLNNVYYCYLPTHCSHGLQPLDNGVFNASKAAYRKELQKLTSLTDSAPVDKVNFIKAYARARAVALMHPEIQPDKKEMTPGSNGYRDGQVDSDHTPTTSRHIRDLGKNKSPSTRRRYSVISRGFEAQESKIASLSTRIASLEEEVGRLSRGKKRKAIPNPNKRFMALAEVLVAGDTISEPNEAIERADAVEDVIEVGGMEEDERSNSEEEELTVVGTACHKLAEESTAELEVIQNNATRWNSTYMMIERALVKQYELNSFIQELGLEADASKRVPTADILTSDDWKVLREEVITGMAFVLEHLEDWKVLYEDETADPAAEEWYTTQGEEAGPVMGVTSTLSRPPTVGQIRERPSRQSRLPSRLQGYEITPLRRRRETALPARPPASSQFNEDALPVHSREDYLQDDARSVSNIASIEGQERASIRASINNAWIKLNEYYTLLGRSPLFAASVVLNPDLGLRWLETNWTSLEQLQRLRDAKDGIKVYFERCYSRNDDDVSESAFITPSLTPRPEQSRFEQWIKSRQPKLSATGSELKRYYRLKPEQVDDPIC